VPYCIHCGGFHADDAAFCPFCGREIGQPLPPPLPRGISAVFGQTISTLTGKRPWSLLLIAFLAWLVNTLTVVGAVLAALAAAFHGDDLHHVVNRACIEHSDQHPGCSIIRGSVDWAALSVVAVVGIVVLGVVSTCCYIVVFRRCDREVGSGADWPLMPSPGMLLRTIGRSIGWGFLAYLALGAASGISIGIPVATTQLIGNTAVIALAVTAEAAALAYLWIWWLIPWAIRAALAWTRVLVDDWAAPRAWRSLAEVPRGQLWGFLGMLVLFSVGFNIVQSVGQQFLRAGAAAAVIGILIYVVAQVLWMVVLPSVQVASMRFLSSDPPTPAVPPAMLRG
jgi:hypothetical protein